MEVEEIRDVNGEHYRKVYLIDYEVDPRLIGEVSSGAERVVSKR